KKNATPTQIALAWLLAQKPWIVPIRLHLSRFLFYFARFMRDALPAHVRRCPGGIPSRPRAVENLDEISVLFYRCWYSVSYGWDKDRNSAIQCVFVCCIKVRLSFVLSEIVTEEILNGRVEFG